MIRGLGIGQERYLERQKEQAKEYEARCRRCGACCGVKASDPCINLIKDGDDKYFCKAYDNRIGQQVTVSGKSFSCIPIRVFLQFNPPYPKCAYSK